MKKRKISWKLYKESIKDLGFLFSINNFLFSFAFLLGSIIFISILYKIHIIYIIILSILGAVLLPTLFKSRYIGKYEEKRFMDLCSYMEQLCSSFQKDSKILSGLKDVYIISDGRLKLIVKESIYYIENGISIKENIYAEALTVIENKYACKRLFSLHKLLEKVEVSGGDYYSSLAILLRDIQCWMERTIQFQKNKKSMRVNYVIVLILSLLSCTLATIMSYMSVSQDSFLSNYLDITGNTIYQIVTSIFIASCIVSFILIQQKLSGSWLEQINNERLILDDYQVSINYPYQQKIIKRVPTLLIMLLISILLLYYNNYLGMFTVAGFGLIFIFFPLIKYKTAYRRTIEEIRISFPEWLRDIALNLQYQTIQMSIQYSLESAPIVLKSSVEKLIKELDENTTGIEPYHNFLMEFGLTDIKSAMRMLYSMTELSHDKTDEMLYMLIDRNYNMIEKAQKSYDNNKITALKQLLYLPMIFSVFKIVIDLFLFANSFFTGFAEFNNFMV